MSTALVIQALDLVLIGLLAGAVYWPRHRRRDLVVAYVGINVGVMAVAAVLANSAATAGLGLGLFGVLSIIRLRSDELSQSEIAYYFASLALGLVAGLAVTPVWLSVGVMLLIVATLAVVDAPFLMSRHRRTSLVLDRAILDADELELHLSLLLGARITGVTVHEVDQVRDTTSVSVRYQVDRGRAEEPAAPAAPRPLVAAAPAPHGAAEAPDAPGTRPEGTLLAAARGGHRADG
jgi:hypothetical protein